MTYKAKKEVTADLLKRFGDEKGVQASLLGEIVKTIEAISEEDSQKSICSKPDFEAMYQEEHLKVQELLKIQDGMAAEIRCLHSANARLTGFKEAIELVYGKGRDFHGCG